ncbi:MAG: diaminopimelate aminotransferase [candidate division Zixibacteria bacterium 4484_95]|nr:MAG: diaminopimelate aminotransferase [candidate division Zixibacteria bacterium 4484_95]RKX17259.1 MAG: diaminopimelate aminotransferase [candidate division Zixibacteria bacterium]
MFQKLSEQINDYKQKVIDIQKLLVSIPALAPENDGDGEIIKAEALMEFLQKDGFPQPELYPADDKRVPSGKRPNIVYRFKGQDSSRRIWVMSHLDVVPAGELSLWNSDPFSLKIEGDKLIGRGVEDNHQGIVSSYAAAKALIDQDVIPKYDVCLLFVADEEVGSTYGIQYILDNHDLFNKDDLIIVPDAGVPSGTDIEVAEKSIVWLKVETKGKQAHASRPELAKNAFKAASNLVVKIDELYNEFDIKDELYEPPYSTFEPTKKEANVPNVNTIPGDDVFYIDCRVLPDYPLKEVEDKIRMWADEIEKRFDVKISFSSSQRAEAATPTSVDSPVVKALSRAIKKVYNVQPKPCGIGGGTVAAIFRRAGYSAAVWSKLNETAHQPNEYAYISNILGDAKVFAHVFVEG